MGGVGTESAPYHNEAWFVVRRDALVLDRQTGIARLDDQSGIASAVARGALSAFMFTTKQLAKDFIKRFYDRTFWTAICPQGPDMYADFLEHLREQGYTHLIIDDQLHRSVRRALRLMARERSR